MTRKKSCAAKFGSSREAPLTDAEEGYAAEAGASGDAVLAQMQQSQDVTREYDNLMIACAAHATQSQAAGKRRKRG